MPLHKSVRKKYWRWAFAWMLLALVSWIVYQDDQAIAAIQAFPMWAFPCMTLVVLLYELLCSWRLSVIGRAAGGIEVSGLMWLRLYIVGRAANMLFPQAGNIFRAVSLRKNFKISYSKFVSMAGIKAWLEAILAFSVGSALLSCCGAHLTIGGVPVYVLLLASLILIVIVPVSVHWALSPSGQATAKTRRTWIFALLKDVSSLIFQWVLNKQLMVRLSTVTLLVLFCSGLAHYLALRALGMEINLSLVVILVVFLRLTNYVAVTPGNLGVREIMYGLTGALMDFSMAHAMLISALIRLSTYTVILPLAFLLEHKSSVKNDLAE